MFPLDYITPILKPNTPSHYEGESWTALELTAKSAAKVNELIDAYNKFVSNINTSITDFKNGQIKTDELFRMEMSQKFQDFIDVIEIAYDGQNLRIEESVEYLQANFKSYVEEQVRILYEDGDLEENILNAVNNLADKFEATINDITSYKNTINLEMSDFKDEVNNTTSTFIEEANNQITNLSETASSAVSTCDEATRRALNAVDALNIAFSDINGGSPTDVEMDEDYNGGLIE